LNRGLVAGPIRAQQPPRKLADNGNTLMFWDEINVPGTCCSNR
jgi:hypothetical protein